MSQDIKSFFFPFWLGAVILPTSVWKNLLEVWREMASLVLCSLLFFIPCVYFFLTAFCFLVVELFLFVDDKTGSTDENSESHSRARLVRVIQDQSVICLLFYASAILNNANSIICFIK